MSADIIYKEIQPFQIKAYQYVINDDIIGFKSLHNKFLEYDQHDTYGIDALHNFQNDGQNLALSHVACSVNAINCLKYIIEVLNGNINCMDADGDSLLVQSIVSHNWECFQYILSCEPDVNQICSEGRQSLHYACVLGEKDMIQSLLDINANINFQDARGWTPFMWCLDANAPMSRVLASTTLLINYKANINLKDNDGMTALHWACEYKIPYMVKMLLWHRANASVKNAAGYTPLYIAELYKTNLSIRLLNAALNGDNEKKVLTRICKPIGKVCNICNNSPDDSIQPPEFCCRKCGLWTHQQCYDAFDEPSKSRENWKCDSCIVGAKNAICCLCPVTTGLLKKTDDNRWIHVRCSLFHGEIGRPLLKGKRSIIENVRNVHKDHFDKLMCKLCNIKVGACIECAHGSCRFSFHPLCGRLLGLREEYCLQAKAVSFCVLHHFVKRAISYPQQISNGTQSSIQLNTSKHKKKKTSTNNNSNSSGRKGKLKTGNKQIVNNKNMNSKNSVTAKKVVKKQQTYKKNRRKQIYISDSNSDVKDTTNNNIADFQWSEAELEALLVNGVKYKRNWDIITEKQPLITNSKPRSSAKLKRKWEELQLNQLHDMKRVTYDSIVSTNNIRCYLCSLSNAICQGSIPCRRCEQNGRGYWCTLRNKKSDNIIFSNRLNKAIYNRSANANKLIIEKL